MVKTELMYLPNFQLPLTDGKVMNNSVSKESQILLSCKQKTTKKNVKVDYNNVDVTVLLMKTQKMKMLKMMSKDVQFPNGNFTKMELKILILKVDQNQLLMMMIIPLLMMKTPSGKSTGNLKMIKILNSLKPLILMLNSMV